MFNSIPHIGYLHGGPQVCGWPFGAFPHPQFPLRIRLHDNKVSLCSVYMWKVPGMSESATAETGEAQCMRITLLDKGSVHTQEQQLQSTTEQHVCW